VGGRKTTFFSAGNRERVIRDKRFDRPSVRACVRASHGRIAVARDLETIETSGFFHECPLLLLQLLM
jgi:hypothetical protein